MPVFLFRAQGDPGAVNKEDGSKHLQLWLKSNLRDAAGAGVGVLVILFCVFVARAFMGLTPLPWSILDIFGTAAVTALLVIMLRRPRRGEPGADSSAA